MAAPRRDRRSPAKDEFGKPGVTFPDASLAHPTVVETDDGRQTTRAPVAFLAAHPDTGKYPNAKKVGHQTSPGENANTNVTEAYETLPSVALTGKAMSDAAQGAIVNTSSQRLIASTADVTPTFTTLEYSDQPLDANRKQRSLTTLAATSTASEVTRVITTGVTAASLENATTHVGKFFLLEDADGPVYVWAKVNATWVDPAPSGRRGIPYAVSNAVPQITTVSLLGATPTALANKYTTLADNVGAVYGWFNVNAGGTDPAPGGRGIVIPITGNAYEVSTVLTTGGVATALANKAFRLRRPDGVRIYVWFNLDAAGVDPLIYSLPTGYGIAVPITTGQSEASMATAIQTAMVADASFSAVTVAANLVTITHATYGAAENINTGTSGLTVATLIDGSTAYSDVQIATAARNAFDADAKFSAVLDVYEPTLLTITDASNGVRTASTAGNSGLTVVNTQTGVTTTTSASGIATAIQTAVHADAGFNATVATNTVTITDAAVGPRTDADAGDSGFAVTTITQGQSAAAFPPLIEYDQDPDTQSLITSIYQIVDAALVTAPTAVNGQITQYRPRDKLRSLKVVTTYSTPAGGFTEQRFAAHRFETCLIAFLAVDGCGVFEIKEEGRSANVSCRTVTTYGAFQEVIGQRIFTNSFRLGDFNESDILNDANCLIRTGSCVVTFNIRASSPTASEYLALFDDTYRLIDGESVHWKAGIYRTTKRYVRFPRKPVVNAGTC